MYVLSFVLELSLVELFVESLLVDLPLSSAVFTISVFTDKSGSYTRELWEEINLAALSWKSLSWLINFSGT